MGSLPGEKYWCWQDEELLGHGKDPVPRTELGMVAQA